MVFTCFLTHQITAMYIDGHLKGGFQTVEAYAGFCGYFKNWLDTKSIKLNVPRQGEMVAEDYRACLEYVNSEVSFSLRFLKMLELVVMIIIFPSLTTRSLAQK